MFEKLFQRGKLQSENKRLKQLNAMRADIISINAHQLRTSLTAMKWVLKMFNDGDFGNISPEQQKYIVKLYERNERMISLVSEMLSVNKDEEMNVEYKIASHDVTSLIENIIFDFSGESRKNNIEIIFNKPESIPSVLIDPEKIRVVFQNLIENAIKYSNPGSKILISAKQEENNILITVADNGIGISASDQKRIFEKYFRGRNAEAKEPIGTGIGLFTTKRIIEQHSGKIWFESEEHKGTAFHFSIPIAK